MGVGTLNLHLPLAGDVPYRDTIKKTVVFGLKITVAQRHEHLVIDGPRCAPGRNGGIKVGGTTDARAGDKFHAGEFAAFQSILPSGQRRFSPSTLAGVDEKQTGWAFVAVQVVLLGLVLFLPTGDAWERTSSVQAVGLGLNIAGLAIVALGALGLGRSLTPTPVPVEAGELKTGGLYSRMRHPIYTGVMLLAIGIAAASGSLLRALATLVLIAFFNMKARWEEERLVKKFGREYEEYSSQVNRFLPTSKAKIKAADARSKDRSAKDPDPSNSRSTKRGFTEGKGRPTPKRPAKKRKR